MGGSSLSAGHPPRPDAQEVPLGSPMPPQPIREPGPALPHGEPEDVNPNCIALSSQDACCRLPRTTNTPSKRVCPRHPQVSFSESLASSIVLWQQSSRVCDLSEHLSRMTFLPHLPSCIPRPI
ncbi:hypothetical protein WJX84_011430 [Apatococcus fuscideae]|uniref:Uncharacterized protein n=1 Tax=Apatococcus fuscideae TaxID=2026836 RepID=A0AAW1TC12_9CHLO